MEPREHDFIQSERVDQDIVEETIACSAYSWSKSMPGDIGRVLVDLPIWDYDELVKLHDLQGLDGLHDADARSRSYLERCHVLCGAVT